jgi:hypothetical protein
MCSRTPWTLGFAASSNDDPHERWRSHVIIVPLYSLSSERASLDIARQTNDMSHPSAAVNKTLFASHGSWSMARLSIPGKMSAGSSAAMTGRSLPLLCLGRTYAALARPSVLTPAVCTAHLAVRQSIQQYHCSSRFRSALNTSIG